MTDEKKLFCPQCKEWFPVSHFNSLPLDLRCNKCLPLEVSMVLYDQKVALAGQKVANLLDGAEIGRSLKPLARLIDGFYDACGGANAVSEMCAQWVKDLAATGKKDKALAFVSKVMSIHAKVEKTQVEEDWNNLTKTEIKARLAIKMAAILAEADSPEMKKAAIRKITGENLD